MIDITCLINKKSREENQMKKFEKMISDVSTKEDQRILEMHLLRPKPVPEYKGAKSGMSNFKKRTVLFSFPDSKCIKRLGKVVTINAYIENNCHEISFLMELIRLIEVGRIEWHKNRKKYYIKNRNGSRIRL